MSQLLLTGLDRRRLRRWLALFFLALAIPTAILIHQAYSELKWEAFHQHRLQAEELAARIDDHCMQLIAQEEARPFTDYAFLNIAGDPTASFLQRSPLSAYPLASTIPGLIGYFQVDAQGTFSTPLLPQSAVTATNYGISMQELQQRESLAEHIQQILSENRLVHPGERTVSEGKRAMTKIHQQTELRHDRPIESSAVGAGADKEVSEQLRQENATTVTESKPAEKQVPAQAAAFDQLIEEPVRRKQKKQKPTNKLVRVEDLKLDYRYQQKPAVGIPGQNVSKKAPVPEKRARKEQSALPEPPALYSPEISEAPAQKPSAIRIRTFESEIDPFEVSLLNSGYAVLFRKVWRDGQRYIQGALIEQQRFLQEVINAPFHETALSQMSDLIVAYRGDVFSAFSGQSSKEYLSSAEELSGALLHQTRLSTPLNDLELIFSLKRLPAGPGGTVITWVAAVLTVVLCGGFYLLYRLGTRQIDLVRQQQDFVAAVSHELKTPLTSIRMYGEILREGWASEEKKKRYYDYIFDESERLSRLIANVLQLARMTRNEVPVALKEVAVAQLMEPVRSKVASQIERTSFKLNLHCEDEAAQAIILVDADYFTQIVINLVDNAIKFATKAAKRDIDIGCRYRSDGTLVFTVRDYGPGVPRGQMKKIFKLFYRSENELTRETVGTGIGLALVRQLALAMKGQVDVVNKTPGAEFGVRFPTVEKRSKQTSS